MDSVPGLVERDIVVHKADIEFADALHCPSSRLWSLPDEEGLILTGIVNL